MDSISLPKLPARIIIQEIVESRYEDHCRPLSWDARCAGTDLVRAENGDVIRLHSDGGQSPPQPGWEILVRGGDSKAGYLWTLYGMVRSES